MNHSFQLTDKDISYFLRSHMPDTIGKWHCEKYSCPTGTHPHRLYLGHAVINRVPDGVTHIACLESVRIRTPLKAPVKIVAETIIFEKEPVVEVEIWCTTLVLHGPGTYYPSLKLPKPSGNHPDPLFGIRYIYSLGSSFPFPTQPDASIYYGPLPSARTSNINQGARKKTKPTIKNPPYGFNPWHLATIQALTFREIIDLIDKADVEQESIVNDEIRALTDPIVRVSSLRNTTDIPSLRPFIHLPDKDLNILFARRSVIDLSSLVAIPFLSGYQKLGAVDPSKLYQSLMQLIHDTKYSAYDFKYPFLEDFINQNPENDSASD